MPVPEDPRYRVEKRWLPFLKPRVVVVDKAPAAPLPEMAVVPGEAADSRETPGIFQFPVKDGDWRSKAVEANRYIRKRYKKKTQSPSEGLLRWAVNSHWRKHRAAILAKP